MEQKVKRLFLLTMLIFVLVLQINAQRLTDEYNPDSTIADHTVVPFLWSGFMEDQSIQLAKDNLVIAYGHTSHGSQIVSGLYGLMAYAKSGAFYNYPKNLFSVSRTGSGGSLHLFQGAGYSNGPLDHDAGYLMNESEWNEKKESNWYLETREFLDDPNNRQFNVIMWSWCGQLSWYSDSDVKRKYLDLMEILERDYPEVTFIYMTGHLDGTGEEGQLHRNNELIRAYCRERGKWLFDFADIESFTPDGKNVLVLNADDECYYSGGNWAREWQDAHPGKWFPSDAAHSQALNANMKAYAAWWLFARIAGWDGLGK
jgi:hypothetical protein